MTNCSRSAGRFDIRENQADAGREKLALSPPLGRSSECRSIRSSGGARGLVQRAAGGVVDRMSFVERNPEGAGQLLCKIVPIQRLTIVLV